MAAEPLHGSKTALELALELGVRSETVLRAMRSAGYDVDDPTTEVDSLLEQRLVEEMVDQGELPKSMASGKGRRKLTDDPVVNDDAVTEALGASPNGFSKSFIPRQITLESSFDKPPSFFSRMFSTAKNLARTLKNSEYTQDELNAFFAETVPKETKSHSSIEEPVPKIEDGPVIGDIQQEDVSAPELDAIDDYVPNDDEIDDGDMAGMEDLQESGLEDMSLDPDMMEDLEEVDLGDADLNDDLAGLSEELGLSPEDFEGVDDEDLEEGAEELTEGVGDELDGVELDDEDLELLDDESAAEGGEHDGDVIDEDEEEYVPNFLEKILSRIHLSPTETWALIGGASMLMIAVLVVAVYWWMYYSPKAQYGIFEEALAHYNKADEIAEEYDYVAKERWKERAGELEAASGLFEKYISDFPETDKTPDAYKNWCDITFGLAGLYEDNKGEGDTDPIAQKSEEAYRQSTKRYGTYLEYLQQTANRAVEQGKAGADLYISVEEQKEALWRIALSQKKLKRFQEAIDQLDQFSERFSASPESIDAITQIGDIYQEWAKSDKEEEPNMLNKATERYKQALERLEQNADNNRLALSQLHAELGDIQYRLYERSQEQEKEEQADAFLRESIGHYEAAEQEVRKVNNLTTNQRNLVLKPLADMYLMRGRAAGDLWNRNEESAKTFPEGIIYRQTLLDEADRQRQLAQDFLSKANTLYDEMITTDDKELKEDIIYNKTEALFIMRKYPEALAAGRILTGDDDSAELSPSVDAKLHYLLGHVAWEMAKDDKDYTNVKKFYRKALEKDPFYPKERQGEISHLATLRLTNSYFLVDKDYEGALSRFRRAIADYPDTDYTFLTLYWMGKALDEYGESLNAQANEIEAKSQTESSKQQAKALRDKAAKLYKDSVLTYDRAIESRDRSKFIDVQNKSYLIEIMFNRGHSAYFAGEYREAEKLLQEAMDKHKNDAAAKKYVPESIERQGDINALLANYDKAIDYYREYLGEAYPDPDARVKMKLADAYLRHFSPDRAREWYNRIVRDYGTPKDEKGPGFEALKKIARSHIQEAALKIDTESDDEFKKAIGAFDELARRYPLPNYPKLPDDAESLHAIGNIQYRLKNYPESISAYKAYLRHANAPQRTGIIRYRIGQAYMDMNQPAQAVQELGNITEQSMDNLTQYADALILMGEAYEEQANQYQQSGDDGMYELYLRKAEEAYNRVKITRSADRIAEADTKRKLIASILARLREQQELARTQQQQGG